MYFNYFFPNRRAVKLPQLVELGLGYAFDPETSAAPKTPFEQRPVTNGPGGQHGLIVSLSDEYCGYYKDLQEWKQEIDTEYWVGMWRDKPPTPDTLARENQIAGHWLRLEDGHDWLLPLARHWSEFDGEVKYERTLPARLTRTATGEWRSGDVKIRYRELWRLATELMAAIAEGTVGQFTEYDNLVIECFQCNYRVSAIELDLLGVYDDHVRQRVPGILLDLENFNLLLKKKLATLDTGISTGGPVVSPPVAVMAGTTQPSVT